MSTLGTTDALEDQARRAAIAAEVKARRSAQSAHPGSALSRQQIIDRLNVVPTFSVMRATPVGHELIGLTFRAEEGERGVRCCAFFTDPTECRDALQQAQAQHPGMRLAIGTTPLGRAFALAAGWTAAQSKAPFALRAAPATAERLRPLLITQLAEAGLSTLWHFPVFLCEELRSPACVPVFLGREELAAAWTASGRAGLPTGTLVVTDLRIVVRELQKGAEETGCDWSRARFIGSDTGWRALREGAAQADAKGLVAGTWDGVEGGMLGIVGGDDPARRSEADAAGKGEQCAQDHAAGPGEPAGSEPVGVRADDADAEPPELV
jgi:hypothetical protein